MRNRNLLIGLLVVVVVGGGAWALFGWRDTAGARAGAGPYTTEVADCQDRVHGDEMHVAELEFAAGTVWHETSPALKVGGKFTKPGPRGPKTSYSYECTFQGGRVAAAQVR